MRLTNLIRDSFVAAAMQDVPKVDYEKQIIALYHRAMLDAMPPELVGLYEKHKDWFNHSYKHVHGVNTSFRVVSPENTSIPLTPERTRELGVLLEAHKQQRQTRNDLQAKLHGVAYGVTTRKALVEALPEFEKYLPKEEDKPSRSLPAIANLVADFTKAGWPKQQTKVSA